MKLTMAVLVVKRGLWRLAAPLLLLLVVVCPAASFICVCNKYSECNSRSKSTRLFAEIHRERTASERARRDEDLRRALRKTDVVIGKTSALQNATDYTLNPDATQHEFLQKASKQDRLAYEYTSKGMACLKRFRVQDAWVWFAQVFAVKPTAYVWQAGIAKYYLNDFKGASALFERNAQIYERMFERPATEERIWKHACDLKVRGSMTKQEQKKVKNNIDNNTELIQTLEPTDELLGAESRKVFRIARELFDATITNNHAGIILSRAKLRLIGGALDDASKLDRKLWKLTSWFYLGLHYDAIGEVRLFLNDHVTFYARILLTHCFVLDLSLK
jgi:tetratricopeptide (TPR) repeat protein